MHRPRRGANAVEFALIAPVLVAMLTGLMDYGYFYALRHAAGTTARIGAREGSLTGQADGPEQAALAAATERWEGFGLAPVPVIQVVRSGNPETIQVHVTIDGQALIGLVPGPGTIQATALKRMAEQP